MKWLLWWTTLKKNNQKEKLVKIGQGGTGANSILFLLPSIKETALVAAHLVKRDMENENRQIRYVIHQNGLPFYSENLKPSVSAISGSSLLKRSRLRRDSSPARSNRLFPYFESK